MRGMRGFGLVLLALACFVAPAVSQIVIWEPVRGPRASDIAIAADGTAWVVGTTKITGGYDAECPYGGQRPHFGSG